MIALNPNDAIAFINRGNAKRAKNDNAGAFADYDHAIAVNPNLALAFSIRRHAKGAKNDYEGAIADYDRAIALNSGYSQAYFGRANVRNANGDFPGALVDYEKVIALQPKEAEYARFYQNLTLRQLGRADEDDLAKQVPGWKESWKKRLALFSLGNYRARNLFVALLPRRTP